MLHESASPETSPSFACLSEPPLFVYPGVTETIRHAPRHRVGKIVPIRCNYACRAGAGRGRLREALSTRWPAFVESRAMCGTETLCAAHLRARAAARMSRSFWAPSTQLPKGVRQRIANERAGRVLKVRAPPESPSRSGTAAHCDPLVLRRPIWPRRWMRPSAYRIT